MRRLIERGLMFGNLVRVDSPVLVERYRRALRHLTGQDTEETEFHVDISGFSPEVAEALGEGYLDGGGDGVEGAGSDGGGGGGGVNRQFILLSTEQKRAPLLRVRFSPERAILKRFVEGNEAELFALTARDAVAGELVFSALPADAPARLLDIRQASVEADTTGGAVAAAERLRALVGRFKSEPDAWWDDALIAEMAGAAAVTGDLTRNPIRLGATTAPLPDFWTPLFGGLYAFRDASRPFAVAAGGDPGPLPGLEAVEIGDRGAVARLLDANDLAEPVVTARGPEVAALLRAKMDGMVADLAAADGRLSEATTRRELRALARRYAGRLPLEWEGLAQLVAWAEEGARWPRVTSEHPAYFYTLRAKAGPDAELVNRLLAELAPLDPVGLFICHKELFYRLYRTWPEGKQAWVAETLAREYVPDKARAREAMFGAGAGAGAGGVVAGPWGRAAAPPPRDEADRLRDLVDRVGPWGALGRR